MLAPVRTVAPEIPPVSLDEVKGHLRVDHTDDDELIKALIGAAVTHLDGWSGILGRCMVEQTWRQDFECFASCLSLPLGPVIGIVDVVYKDKHGADQTIDAANYLLRTDAGGRSRLEFATGVTVPGFVSARYRAGYPTTPAVTGDDPAPAKSTVPDDLKVAIVMHVKANYDRLTPEERASYDRAFKALIATKRRVGV
jgi:uncharacterized phiE125 gp8 family phage protein